MRFEQFAQKTRRLGVFDSSLALPFYDSPQQAQRQLSDWTRMGRLIQLRRGVYAFPPPYENERPLGFRIANRLVQPSYVSLQSALSFYGLIPEHVATITSVTTGRPTTLRNDFGRFSFRHVKTDLFFGYRYQRLSPGQSAFLATPEKALLDLIYLTPHADDVHYLRELRLQNLDVLAPDRLTALVKQTDQPKLERALPHLLTIVAEEQAAYITL